jgi:hypothetical protein
MSSGGFITMAASSRFCFEVGQESLDSRPVAKSIEPDLNDTGAAA